MTFCIFTVIKNEHEYLDEWIQYHLNLGINHIFIFEDYDSESHKDICHKYKDNVSLNSIFDILDDDDKNKAKKIKTIKKGFVHPLYLKKGLLYLKTNFDIYDWCFTIDTDEFIFLENNNLNNTLLQYKDYDAIILSWKCYGANGLINKPDYTKQSIIDIYNKQIDNSLLEKKPKDLFKTCYNLKKYNEYFFYNTHNPSIICKWCNSIYKKDKMNLVYKNIYINHYITRSWEEYVWKIKTRGYMWGLDKNYDFFFKVNPDMLSIKDKLITQIK